MEDYSAVKSRTAWRIDGEMRGGHSVAETIAWASWTADFEDEQVQRRALPAGVISPDIDPRERVRGFLRRLRGWE